MYTNYYCLNYDGLFAFLHVQFTIAICEMRLRFIPYNNFCTLKMVELKKKN